MFLEWIKVIETSPCLSGEEKFKAVSRASASMNELLPYMRSMVGKAKYQPDLNYLKFKKGIVGITLRNDEVNVTRVVNQTELREVLDWIKDLVNDVCERKEEIVPDYKATKIVPALHIYQQLPKTNCGKCGYKSCMAFAAQLNKIAAEVEDCPLLGEEKYLDSKKKLIIMMTN